MRIVLALLLLAFVCIVAAVTQPTKKDTAKVATPAKVAAPAKVIGKNEYKEDEEDDGEDEEEDRKGYGDKKPASKPEPKPEHKPEPKPEHKPEENKGYGDHRPEEHRPEEHKPEEHKGYGDHRPEEHRPEENKGYGDHRPEEHRPEENKGYGDHRPEENDKGLEDWGYGEEHHEEKTYEHREPKFLTHCTFTDSICQQVTSCVRVKKGGCAVTLDGNSMSIDFDVREGEAWPEVNLFFDNTCSAVPSRNKVKFDQCLPSPSTFGYFILYNPWDYDK